MSGSLKFAPLFFVFSGMAMAEEGILLGEAAERQWQLLPQESEWHDDGWMWRQDHEWLCKKYFDTDLREYFFECYQK